MKKILSVCIPTYNMDTFLPRCLDSFIIDKNYMDMLEVIIVNDGSKDNSSKIAHKYSYTYPNTYKVIDKSNGNYGSCINAALNVATGKYFKICDADDHYDTSSLASFLDFLKNTASDIVFSPFSILNFDSSSNEIINAAKSFIGKEYLIDDIDWHNPEIFRFRAMHAMCTRTQLLKDNNYYQTEGISYTDMQFVFYSCLYAKTCSFFGKSIYLYYLGRDGQTMSKTSKIKFHMHFYKNADRILDDYIKLPTSINVNRRELLFRSLMAVAKPFAVTIARYIKDVNDQTKCLDGLLSRAQLSEVPCPIEDKLCKDRAYRIWKHFHIPHILVYYIFNK